MKKLRNLYLMAAAALILTGCQKDDLEVKTGGGLATASFSVQLDNGVSTKAAADGDGQAASVNRCIMEIYYQGDLIERQYNPVSNKTANFEMTVRIFPHKSLDMSGVSCIFTSTS